MFDQVNQRRGHLAQVVRRNLGRHPHCDAVGTVHQQTGHDGGKNLRLYRLAVEVGVEVDRAPVNVLHHGDGELRKPCFRVPVGGRRVPIHRTEIAFSVNQRMPLIESLGEPYERVVDRSVPVRVVLLEDLPDDSRAFGKGAGREQTLPEHRVENPALPRFQAVPDIRERAPDDHRHGVVHVGLRHFGLDVLDALIARPPHRTVVTSGRSRGVRIRRGRFRHPGW